MTRSEYFDDLLEVLLDQDRELNPAQLGELSDLDTAQLDQFEAAWHGTPEGRRQQIAKLLGELSADNLELLFDRVNRVLLSDSSAQVRQQAIRNLWEDEHASLGRRLVELADLDPSETVRLEAVRALGRFVYLGEFDKLTRDTKTAIEEVLLNIMRDPPSPTMQRLALESLGYSTREELPELIRRSYDSADEELMRSALVAMGRSANSRWLDQVVDHLNDRSPRLRAAAARAVGELLGRKSTSTLIELLDDANDEVRQAAVWSLGQVGGDEARDALLELQKHESGGIREQDIDQALDHIAFLEGTPNLTLFDFDIDE
ncbi:MAG: HEAT repeat domain-containing protein [Anaerolineales bacterium]